MSARTRTPTPTTPDAPTAAGATTGATADAPRTIPRAAHTSGAHHTPLANNSTAQPAARVLHSPPRGRHTPREASQAPLHACSHVPAAVPAPTAPQSPRMPLLPHLYAPATCPRIEWVLPLSSARHALDSP